MKLQNKKTGEILRVEFLSNWQTDDGTEIGFRDCNSLDVYSYNSLAELNEDWEDYEEQKDNSYWYIDDLGRTHFSSEKLDEIKRSPNDWMTRKLFGNYFETKEEVKKAVEKLKAWKRLKDVGFKFKDFARLNDQAYIIRATSNESWTNLYDDLELLFGGEE